MARKNRENIPGGIFHIIHRGCNNEKIFSNNICKEYYLNMLFNLKLRYDYKVLVYVVMDDHCHLIIKQGNDPSWTFMQRLGTNFAKYYNKINDRSGSVFEGRYKAYSIEDNRCLFTILNYIHFNPLRHDTCMHAVDYTWSSDIFYRGNDDSLVDIDVILDLLSLDRHIALDIYKARMNSPEKNNKEEFIASLDHYKLKSLDSSSNKSLKSLDEILFDACQNNKKIYENIKRGYRHRELTFYKIQYILLARKYKYSVGEIAKNINITPSAIHLILKSNKCI